jgi:hypothetical protein
MSRFVAATLGLFLLAAALAAAWWTASLIPNPLPSGHSVPLEAWLIFLVISAAAGGAAIAVGLDQNRAGGGRDLRLAFALTTIAVLSVAGAAALLAAPAAVVPGVSGELAVEMVRLDGEARLRGALVLLLAAAGTMAVVALLTDLAGGRTVNVESHWGGLGGGIGGWTVSSPLIALVIALACLGGMVALATSSNDTGADGHPRVEDEKAGDSGVEPTVDTTVIKDEGAGKKTAPSDRSE